MNKTKISFPQMANYYIPAKYLFSHVLNCEVITPPKITDRTIEIGSNNSPEFICAPFKYTLGTIIECLELGADTLLQIGGGCKYGFYSELQKEILKELGYDFKLYNLVTAGRTDIKRVYKIMKTIDSNFSAFKGLYHLFITSKMIKYMDKIDDFIRLNIGFEVKKNSFINLHDEMLEEFSNIKNGFDLYFKYIYYLKKFKKIKIKKPRNHLKVGVIGELYTLMEPFSNYFLEYELAKSNIAIKRFTNVRYLLFTKKRVMKKALNKSKKYMKYEMEADSSTNVYWANFLCKKKYDGIIHIKSSFCNPEIAIMPILNKIGRDNSIPIIYFSFDVNTSEIGVKTRLEAFSDMLEMRSGK